MIRYLSYPITKTNPIYGCAQQEVQIVPCKSILAGDSCNTFFLGIENHWGTHIDAPAHFFDNGKEIGKYPADTFLFNHPQVVTLCLGEGQVVNLADLPTIGGQTDLLLLQSRWGRYRGSEMYSCCNPSISPELGFWLRKNFPSVKAIGLDWISLSSCTNREMGRAAHRSFLDPSTEGHPILIIEDMNLSFDLSGLMQVICAPLLVESLDSAPCTVFGVFEQ